MARVISIVNQKGGVGKTTTAVNLGAYLAHFGKLVLLIDLDPQANATSGLGHDHRTIERGTYDVLVGRTTLPEVLLATGHDGYRLAPSTLDLAGANVELVSEEEREYRLRNAMAHHLAGYDYVLIDCPPSLGLLTLNGLVASDEVLVPIQAEYYALEGLGQLMETIALVRENLKPELRVLGALLTMYDPRYQLSREVLENLYQYFPERIFRSVIPRHIKLAEAPSFGRSIMFHDPASPGGKAYERFARELILRESA